MVERYVEKRIRRKLQILLPTMAVLTIVCAVMWAQHERAHFNAGTKVNGIDCAGLTVEEARDKLEEAIVELKFSNGEFANISGNKLGRTIQSLSELELFLSEQNKNATKEFSLSEESFDVNEEVLSNFLHSLKPLSNSGMLEPQNAYIALNEDYSFEIVEEKEGYVINLKDAEKLVKDTLQSGQNVIDFASITRTKPDVLSSSEELISKVTSMNNVLRTVIIYTLRDGSEYKLDIDTMKEWIYQDENGEYQMAIQEGVEDFVKRLDKEVRRIGYNMYFTQENGETVRLQVEYGCTDTVDVQKEISAIQIQLQTGAEFKREPTYSRYNDFENMQTYLVIDKTNQYLYAFENGRLEVETDVTTGDPTKGWDTPSGCFFLDSKARGYYLRRYNFQTNIWLSFYGDYGIHDSNRTVLGGNIYKGNGSHGCVNAPSLKVSDAAERIYMIFERAGDINEHLIPIIILP